MGSPRSPYLVRALPPSPELDERKEPGMYVHAEWRNKEENECDGVSRVLVNYVPVRCQVLLLPSLFSVRARCLVSDPAGTFIFNQMKIGYLNESQHGRPVRSIPSLDESPNMSLSYLTMLL